MNALRSIKQKDIFPTFEKLCKEAHMNKVFMEHCIKDACFKKRS